MISKSTRSFSFLAAAALVAGFTIPVEAGNWGGDFDPTGGTIGFFGREIISVGGSDCTNPVGIEGSAFFYVNGYWAIADTSPNNCTAALTANVTLTTPPPNPPPVGNPPPGGFIDTAHLAFNAPAMGTTSAIWGLDIGPGGTLLAVDSFTIGPASAITEDPLFAGNWFIQPSSNDGECNPFNPSCIDPPPPFNNFVTLSGTNSGNCAEPNSTDCIANVIGGFFPIAAAPEPGSLGLLLGALGAGWLTRRRKAAS